MEARRGYKFLDRGRSPFTGWQWDPPEPGRPGPWLETTGPLELCVNGVHACDASHLLGADLWAVELAGRVVETEVGLIAERARLVERIAAWNEATQHRFGQDCAARATLLAAGHGTEAFAAAARRHGDGGYAASAGYWAAVTAGQSAAGRRDGPVYDRAFAAERGTQAQWLVRELDLATPAA